MACLLGASPGASTAVSAMIEVLNRCFNEEMNNELWQEKLKNMIPSFGLHLNDNQQLLNEIRTKTTKIYNLLMKDKIKLIVSDLDGTLLDSNHNLPTDFWEMNNN